MREVILIKNGELALKGMNRASFEDILIKNIKRKLKLFLIGVEVNEYISPELRIIVGRTFDSFSVVKKA